MVNCTEHSNRKTIKAETGCDALGRREPQFWTVSILFSTEIHQNPLKTNARANRATVISSIIALWIWAENNVNSFDGLINNSVILGTHVHA